MFPQYKQLKYNNDQCYQEHEQGNAIDPMHVLHPSRMRSPGIPFLNVEIFGQLSPYTHNTYLLR